VTISLHYSREDACQNVEEEYEKLFQQAWVRRSNGDVYRVQKIQTSEWYNLPRITEGREGEKEQHIRYMLLRTQVRTFKSCPDNIKFDAIFFTTEEEFQINRRSKSVQHQRLWKRLWKREPLWLKPGWYLSDLMSEEAEDTEKDGNHYQLVELKEGNSIVINQFCPSIQPENWICT
jgi:hypothetical protein